MTTKIVTDEQYGQISKRAHELVLRVAKGAVGFSTAMDGLQILIESKEVISKEAEATSENWIADTLACERQCHLDFFGQEFDLTEFEKTLKKYGRQQIRRWQKLNLEPHFLPKVSMMLNESYHGWKIKPEPWFYQQVAKGKILRNIGGELIKILTVELEGITVLIDTRLKPVYDNGTQMYKNDGLLGPIIQELRKKGKIAKYEYGPQNSRFGVSTNEWENQIKPALAQKLGLRQNQLRLEYAIEANVIPQLYPYMPRQDDGKTNTWVWYEEYFEDSGHRLYGGNSDGGGLAHVHWCCSDFHWSSGSFRPLAVL